MKTELRKFVWIARNKRFNDFTVSKPMTTEDILSGNYPSFFEPHNRSDGGNCEFMHEIYEGDTLVMNTKNSMSDMKVIYKDGQFYGEGPFNTQLLYTYFNSPDFKEMTIYTQ